MLRNPETQYDLEISGVVISGHGVASGKSKNCPYAGGTLRQQMPYFKERGLDLGCYFLGTLNVDVAPVKPNMIAADYTFFHVKWTERIPAEHFSFSRCILNYEGKDYDALIYLPHPETKVEHEQKPTLLEIIAEPVGDLHYGKKVTLKLQAAHFDILPQTIPPATLPTCPNAPLYHFAPRTGWMNDPNGLCYYKGKWHLFYQYYNPAEIDGMQWGHASSNDLLHWEHHLPALRPDAKGQIWSGSAVAIGKAQSELFGGEEGIACYYTYWDKTDHRQSQGMAISADGHHFYKAGSNPIIPQLRHLAGHPDDKDFRDPKVFWHEPTKQWVMAVAGGKLRIFTSDNLRDWTFAAIHPNLETECPDLFPIVAEGETDRVRWVLMRGGTHYQTGDFDGRVFTPDSEPKVFGGGPDFYATQTWDNAPDKRRIGISWLYRWSYGVRLSPTGVFSELEPEPPYGGSMGLPCEMRLRRVANGLRLYHYPVEEVIKLRKALLVKIENAEPAAHDSDPFSAIKTHAVEAVLQLSFEKKKSGFSIQIEAMPEWTIIFGYDEAMEQYYLERTTKRHEKIPGYATRVTAEDYHIEADRVTIRLFTDKRSLEVFIDEGATFFSALLIPCENAPKWTIKTDSSTHMKSLEAWALSL